MTLGRTTHADLEWWLRRAAELTWTYATTYADTAPHSYVVEGRTAGMTKDDYVRAGRVIHTFGRPAKFYAMTGIYLVSPDGRLKWWTMDADVRDTGLINQATTERLYGVQNAPVTESGITTPYDALATSYDEHHPHSAVLATALEEAFASLAGTYPPAVLDVGCGTGRVLDLDVTTPDRYAGVDPSTPMLNQLVRKHPSVAAIYPMRAQDALRRRLFTPGQFDIVTILLERSAELATETVTALEPLASRGLVLAVGDEVEVRRGAGVRGRRQPAGA
jgi:SAM-dependent methyltransferase